MGVRMGLCMGVRVFRPFILAHRKGAKWRFLRQMPRFCSPFGWNSWSESISLVIEVHNLKNISIPVGNGAPTVAE